jgi:hypothetical protein
MPFDQERVHHPLALPHLDMAVELRTTELVVRRRRW